MSDPDTLQERIRKLAGEKANLQLIIDLMNRVGRASGLEDTIQNMLAAISETIGGTECVIYYFVYDALFRASTSRPTEKVVDIDDPLVREVLKQRKPLEVSGEFSSTKMMTPEFSAALTWLAPLMVGSELVGVFKVENLHMPAIEIWPGLPTFVDFAAVVLKNEIIDQTRLSKANDELNRLNKELIADIEMLRKAELELLRATEEEQAVFNAATVGVILTQDQRIIRCNRTMEQLFGYETGELIGRKTMILYSDEETYAEVYQRLLDSIPDKGAFLDERKMLRKDGTCFWCRRTVQAIDRVNLEKGFASTFEDTTVEHAAMEEMAKARAIAEDAATAKSQFLANMSHEIRTPMNSIIGMAHLAMNADPNPRVREYLGKIQSSSRHLLGIINDVLDFSKIEAGKMPIESIDFDLETLVANAVGLVAEKAHEKGLELVVRIDATVPHGLVGDPLRLSQILINYLNNAVKFTESGVIFIEIKPAADFVENGLLYFYVRDSGIGIATEDCSRLFQSFRQVDSSTTRKYGGTGLGLVISKRLAEAMGGDVGVQSTLGKGSIFWFSARVRRSKDQKQKAATRLDLRGRRILVVDDLADAREVISEMLQSMGFIVTTSASGAEALAEIERAAANANRYDIVLLDWKMPGMDGISLTERIRGLSSEYAPVVLMITGYDRDEIVKAAHAAGVMEVLTKPVTPSSLFDAIMNVLCGNTVGLPDVAPLARAEKLDFSGSKALLVEDNELNQEVAVEMLKEIGLSVDIAADGAIAIQKAKTGHYDIILMDLQMPVMDGIEATIQLREDPKFAKTPILAMTASAMTGDREKCLAAGMNDHIAKPIEPRVLQETLSKWLPRSAAREPASSLQPRIEATAGSLFGTIAGLDVEGGLRRVTGKKDLYLRLLRRFAAEQGKVPTQIAEAIEGARLEETKRLVHTLKGVAGNIGAVDVQRAAENLETALVEKRSGETLRDLVVDLTSRVGSLIAQFEQLPLDPPSTTSNEMTREQLEEVCGRLERLLSDWDVQAQDLFRENLIPLRAAYPEICEALERKIENFDFEAALQMLREARG